MRTIGFFLNFLCVLVLFNSCAKKSPESKIWKIVQMKDKFGDTIPGGLLISAEIEGKMSNDYRADAKLHVGVMLLDSNTIGMAFSENNETPKSFPESTFVTAEVKLANGEVKQLEQFFYMNMMCDNKKELFRLLMSQNSPIKIFVDLNTIYGYSVPKGSYPKTIYNFEINPSGLKSVIKDRYKK